VKKPRDCFSVTTGEFYRALLEEFNKLTPEERLRMLQREPWATQVKAARRAQGALRKVTH